MGLFFRHRDDLLVSRRQELEQLKLLMRGEDRLVYLKVLAIMQS